MENKMLGMRRFIYLFCVILSLLFISFYGGNLSYMLFFMMVINSVIAIGYILYVYFSIKIYQEIPERRVGKLESVSYRLMLNNESVIAYRDVKLNFLDGFSQIKPGSLGCVGMQPGCGMKLTGELVCEYSGTYYVGVESIEIMDYFKILRIRFQMPQKLKVTVKPRVLSLEQFPFLEEESHSSCLYGNKNNMPDSEVRKYQKGDSRKEIHWKNSAKRMQWLIRNHATEEKLQFAVFMDGTMRKKTFSEKIISGDKLREVLLSFSYYIYSLGEVAQVFLDDIYKIEIVTKRDFDILYQKITDYSFKESDKIQQVLNKADKMYQEDTIFVVLTAGGKICNSIVNRKIMVIDVDRYETVEDVFRGNGN